MNWLTSNWIIIVALFIMIIFTIRLIIAEPKYSMKEIGKKPWLVFAVLKRAAVETVDIVEEIVDIAKDIHEEVDNTTDLIEEGMDAVKDIQEDIEDTFKK